MILVTNLSQGISSGDWLIAFTVVVSSIGATWKLTNRIGQTEKKLDNHLGYHAGLEAGLKAGIKAEAHAHPRDGSKEV